jgi:hypothetical protein
MKKQTMKFRNPLLLFMLSLWILSGVSSAYAQQIRWLRTGELQSFINEIGAEYESELSVGNTNYFSWPAQYGIDQNTVRMQAVWIGCKNFDDPVEKKVKSVKVIGSGPRDFTDRPNQIFPQEIKLIGRTSHPNVTIDDQPASILDTYDLLDEVDESLPCDRMVLVRFNTSIGISVTKKVMAFANSEHGNYFINDYVFKNTGIVDRAGTVYQQTLNDVWFYFFYRFAFAGVTSSGWGSTWGAFESIWGETTLNHAFGENPNSTDFEMRGFYSYYGPSNRSVRPSAYEEDWGCPNLNEGGVLGSAKYAGCVTLHADKSPQDTTDDKTQPATTWFINSDIPIMAANVSQYDEVFMNDRYTAMSEGHPTKPHDEVVGNQYPILYTDARRQSGGGTSQGQGYGPYTLAPGDSIHIVFAEGVSGMSWEKCREIGNNWLRWYNYIDQPTLILPDGSTTTNHNLYKRKWVETGRDSILLTYRNAIQNYNSGYNIPQPPPPPATFRVEWDSNGICIRLTWSNEPETTPGFAGFDIYRAIGRTDTSYTKIASCNPGTNTYNDISVIFGNDYYYYLVSRNNSGLISSKFYTMTKIKATIKESLSPPTLNSPSNGAYLAKPYSFTWQAVSNAGGYQIKIADDILFTSPIINDQSISGSATSYFTNINLTDGQTYYWQMRTLDSSGIQWGVWSQYESFVAIYDTGSYHIHLVFERDSVYSIYFNYSYGFLTGITENSLPIGGSFSSDIELKNDELKSINGGYLIEVNRINFTQISVTFQFHDIVLCTIGGTFEYGSYWSSDAKKKYTRNGIDWYYYGVGTIRERIGASVNSITGISSSKNEVPKQFNLGQNYPNPFNPSTNISFTLPSKEFISLKVFDMLGREVVTIVSEEMPAGSYTKQWNAAGFASGVYYYRIEAGSFIETKKLVLLR